jgi:tetratricopeptide (TPR) repeat protein
MESNLPGQSYIEKITQIFREEGDVETANALEQQVAVHLPREMTEAESALYKVNKSNARKAIGFGDFERAVEFQMVALGLTQKAFGSYQMKTLKEICELGECHFRNGAYTNALDLYHQALRFSSKEFGELNPFVKRVKKNIRQCADAVRRANSLKNLEKHMNSLFRDALPESSVRIDRMEAIGEKLVSRGKHIRALKVYKALISISLEMSHIEDEKIIKNVMKCAEFLVSYGDLSEAETAYKSVVKLINRQNQMGDKNAMLKIAIYDWAKCLFLLAQSRSAIGSQELAIKISNC